MRKIGILILLNLLLIVFGFGYAHNQLIDYTEIGVEDIAEYIKYFNTAKDVGIAAIKKYNENWDNFVNTLKEYGNISLQFNNNEIIFTNLLGWFTKIIKMLLIPIQIILNFVLFIFNQICTTIYFGVVFILWAAGLRNVLVRYLI